ncbi:hypothetical protein IE53DRAFT_368896 [Violaceomyces palustris]|uniref:Uncharacterized protein n=1 Tax=Violaceomyces palustris TaxID=1673888 RepID=A0ACD0NX93_9BASI|nr:hypothetical protein IE53DRAFT_368896 [Violaceomyces palustris]
MTRQDASKGGYKVLLCQTENQLEEAYKVRIKVFHEEQGYSKEGEVDEYDPVSAHFILVEESEPQRALGTLRLIPYPPPPPPPSPSELDRLKGEGSEQAESLGKPFLPLGPARSRQEIARDFATRFYSGKQEEEKVEEGGEGHSEKWIKVGGAKLGRLALLIETRGKGLGQFLVRQSELWFKACLVPPPTDLPPLPSQVKNQFSTIRLSSQQPVVPFYQSLGYVPIGEPYPDEGQPHIFCIKKLDLI